VLNQLDLTSEQKQQVKAIFDDTRSQLSAIRKKSEPEFREVRRQTDERLKAVLTPEQWDRFQQIMSESKGRRGGRKNRNSLQP
jgi:Spy/CpxP family protein refolding chaperone